MPKRRLSVALLVPSPFDHEVDGMRRAVGAPALGRLAPHLTLVPPVNVRDDRLDDALAVVRQSAGRTRPLTLTLGPPSTFLPDTPVLYLPVGGDPPATEALVALRAAVFTEPLERSVAWPFVPHVTVADGVPADRIEPALTALGHYRVEVTFDRVHLLEEGTGRLWAPLADWPLAAPAVVGRGGLELELTASEGLDPEAAALARRERPAAGRSDGPALVLTARREGRLVGLARGRLDCGGAHLSELVVAAPARGEGVGSHLLAAFAARAAAAGCPHVTADVPAGSSAEAFLLARGWVAERALPRWWGDRDFARLRRRL